MNFFEITNEQRRQLVDAQQVFAAWREANHEFKHSYRGSMHWRKAKGREYLGRKYGKVWESLGARSPETEAMKAAYTTQRSAMRQRATRLKKRLAEMDKINRAYGLGRIPLTAARVLRVLDEVGLLGRSLFVVGTHSLYAYEARAGVIFSSGLTATDDIDLLWDTRRKLSLAVAPEVEASGIMGLLHKADASFAITKGADFRASNDQGYYVDLIRPLELDEGSTKTKGLGDDDDLTAAAILGLQWLINAPKFDEVVVGADGRPLKMSCIDPRAFALHKYWVSKQEDRGPSRKRDADQARAVAVLSAQYLNLKFDAKDLSALPLELVRHAKDIAAISRG
jgi:hypothetical protein